jgi:hypothetical protein
MTRGRPKSINPKTHLYGIRFSGQDRACLDAVMERTGLKLGEIVRMLIRSTTVEEIRDRIGR